MEAFSRLYVENGGNASAAYRGAYNAQNMLPASVEQTACRLLRNLKVASRVSQLQEEAGRRNDISVDRVLQEYARLAFADIKSVMSWDGDGVTLHDSCDLTEAESAAVAEVSETTTKDGGTIRLKMHDKKGALDSLAKYLGMFTDKSELKVVGTWRFVFERIEGPVLPTIEGEGHLVEEGRR